MMALKAIRAALTDEDEIAHGEAVIEEEPLGSHRYRGVGRCAYCNEPWPCRTQRGIDRLLEVLRAEGAPLDRETRVLGLTMAEIHAAVATADMCRPQWRREHADRSLQNRPSSPSE